MDKKTCVICNKELGFLSQKSAVSDGVVCAGCLKAAGVPFLRNVQNFSSDFIKEALSRRIFLLRNFSSTKKVGAYLAVDDNNKWFKIGDDVFEYSDLISFELLEDGHSVTKGGLGRAVVGGMLFGGVGAVVGGVTGKKKSKNVCNSLKIKITLRNPFKDVVYINFIATETKTSSFLYKASYDNAQACLSALEIISDGCESSFEARDIKETSSADEIMKFKQLLDTGVITQEEFEAKKKQLLGL